MTATQEKPASSASKAATWLTIATGIIAILAWIGIANWHGLSAFIRNAANPDARFEPPPGSFFPSSYNFGSQNYIPDGYAIGWRQYYSCSTPYDGAFRTFDSAARGYVLTSETGTPVSVTITVTVDFFPDNTSESDYENCVGDVFDSYDTVVRTDGSYLIKAEYLGSPPGFNMYTVAAALSAQVISSLPQSS